MSSSRRGPPGGGEQLPRRAYIFPQQNPQYRYPQPPPPLNVTKQVKVQESSAQPCTDRRAATVKLMSKLRPGAHPHQDTEPVRHVNFVTPVSQETPNSIHPAYRQHQRPRSGRAGDVTALDHQVASHGGTTSTYEDLPHRLRASKNVAVVDGPQRIVELTKEVGYLRQELAYHKDTREVLMKLYESVKQSHRQLQAALDETAAGVAISEQRLLEYWSIELAKEKREDDYF